MKRCPLSIPFLILFACGGNETHTGDIAYAELKIQVDTVLVDSGEEILMAATRGFGLAISADGKMLYNWDPESSQVEFVDLESMKLLKKQRFEKEGPNGVGTNAHVMRIHPNNQLAFIGWDNAISIADLEGNVSQKIKLNEPWMVEGLEEKGSLSLLAFSEDGIKAYCSLINFKMLSADIVELDIENKQRRILQLPEFEKLDKFRIAWSSADGRGMSMWHPNLSAIPWRGKMLFWTNAMAGVYRFDPAMDSLEWRQYNSLLTAN